MNIVFFNGTGKVTFQERARSSNRLELIINVHVKVVQGFATRRLSIFSADLIHRLSCYNIK
jgi:hypothetical protein